MGRFPALQGGASSIPRIAGPQELDHRLVREVARSFDDLAQMVIQRLAAIGRVQVHTEEAMICTRVRIQDHPRKVMPRPQ
jgi:hypothetical protein